MTQATMTASWDRRLRYLPFAVLTVATTIAFSTAESSGATSPSWRITAQLGALAATTCLLVWAFRTTPSGRTGKIYYTIRTALAVVLTALNPLFCIYAWIGYIDADDHFRGRAFWAAIGVTAITMGYGQSGGSPFDSRGHAMLFVMLVLLNFGLASALGRWSVELANTSQQRAEVIVKLEQALAENEELHQTVVAQAKDAGVQEERQRLAGEVHDTIAQSLAGIVAQLQAAQDDPTGRSERIEHATDLARDALAEARRSVHAWAPIQLTETDLPAAVAGLVGSWEQKGTAKADVVVTGAARPLHPEVDATVLRITQESLANIARHARATRVGVTLSYDEDEVILDVRDDGIGFDPNRMPPDTSFGLRGMRQRAERLAGVLDIESEPSAGTAVSLRLPALARGAA